MRAEYHVYAPDGYCCIEIAESDYEARQKASRRPGYQPPDALRVEFYKPFIPAVSREGLNMARRKLEETR